MSENANIPKTEPDPGSAPEPTPAPRKTRRRIGLMAIVSVLVILVGVPILFLAITGASVRAPDWVTDQVEQRLNSRINTGRVALNQIDLTLGRNMRPEVRMQNVGLFDKAGSEIARLNEVSARFVGRDLIRGAVTLKSLRVSGAQITVRRSIDGTFALSLGGGGGTQGSLAGVLDGLDRAFAAAPLAELQVIAADELTITLEDSRSGRLWQVTDGRIALTQTSDALDLTVSADVFNGTEELATTVIGFRTQKGSTRASLTATFENAAAVDIAAQSPALAFLSVLDAPISGALRATIDDSGEISDIAGTLEIAAGALQPRTDTPPIPFESGRAYVVYDKATQALTFTEVSLQSETASLSASGTAYLQKFNAGWPAELVGQFALRDVSLTPENMFAEPMAFTQGAVDFRLRLDPFVIDIGQVALQNNDQRFHGDGRVGADENGWNVALNLKLNTIPLDRLLALWPVAVATGTRNWLERNVLAGDISNLAGAFRLATQSPPQVSISFQYSGADVKVMTYLPPIRNAEGYASLNGKTYTMVMEKGGMTAPKGGHIDLTGSVLRIGDISIPQPKGEIDLRTQSTITGAMSLMDLRPFELMKRADMAVDVAEGQAQIQADLSFDFKQVITFDDVTYAVRGVLSDVTSDKLVEGRSIAAKSLNLVADAKGISISGPGTLGKVPAEVTWTQAFGPQAAGSSRVEGTVELSQAFLDEFQIALPKGSVSGAGVAQVVVDLSKTAPPKFTLVSDLNRIGLSLVALDWRKARNATGALEVVGRLGDTPAIDRLSLRAPGLSASGIIDLTANGGLETAQFDRVVVGKWLDGPVTLRGRGANRSPAVEMSGGSIDMRAATFGSGGGSSEGGPLSLSLNRLTVSEGITLTSFRGNFKEGTGLRGDFSARVNGKAAVRGSVVPTPSGSAVRLLSDDAGGVLAASDIISNARGGSMDLTLNPTGREGTYDGRLKIRNTRIVDAPALTELISAISIVGLLDQVNSGGISLNEMDAEFRLSPDTLTMYYSSAVGPSLGISLDGVYDLKNDRLDMQGVLSPVYFLNGIGQIFSRGREGLFGFSYRLSGNSKSPRVRVNPLSILTPGAFREIFRRPPPSPSQ